MPTGPVALTVNSAIHELALTSPGSPAWAADANPLIGEIWDNRRRITPTGRQVFSERPGLLIEMALENVTCP